MSKTMYRSNHGKGPLLARIVSVDGKLVTMERWHEKRPGRRTRFLISRDYLTSRMCGWKKVVTKEVQP